MILTNHPHLKNPTVPPTIPKPGGRGEYSTTTMREFAKAWHAFARSERAAGYAEGLAAGLAPLASRPANRGKILLVEDHSDVRRLLRTAINAKLPGFDVLEADNGATGLAIAREQNPALVCLDIGMPGELDGLQVLDAIRGDADLKHTRVIMVTARGKASDYEDGMRRGADAYFIKPFSPLQVITAILELLGVSPA